ncbi:hypothetical protein D3C72_1738040 [compost metagenome]
MDVDRGQRGRLAGGERVEAVRGKGRGCVRVGIDAQGGAGRKLRRLLHHGGAFLLEQHRLGSPVVQDIGQLLRRQPVVDRVEHRTQPRRGQQRKDKGRRVVEKRCHHVALADAQRPQPVGVAVDLGIELRIRPGLPRGADAADQRGLAGQVACRPGKGIAKGEAAGQGHAPVVCWPPARAGTADILV